MTTNQVIYFPQRLVMFACENNCMFCTKPKGPSIVAYVDVRENMGFITCDLCKEKMEDAIKLWDEKEAYGKVRYLKDSIIKIKRTSGEIDDGWKLGSPFIKFDQIDWVYCVDYTRDLQKWCQVEDIIRLNPAPNVTSEGDVKSDKNLCVTCGIDMGDNNPRQLCGKTQCDNDWYNDNEIINKYINITPLTL